MAEVLQENPEHHARLSGMMAILALPPVRQADGVYRKRKVWIEVAPDSWDAIDSFSIEHDKFTFWHSAHDARTAPSSARHPPRYVFTRGDGPPRWMTDRQEYTVGYVAAATGAA